MAVYILNEPTMFSDIADNIAIVINTQNGVYYGMNSFGTEIFRNLINGVPPEILAESAASIEGAPTNTADMVLKFINELLEYEVIVEGINEESAPEINAAMAKEDSFIMIIQEFQEAQEMLMADPIHQVRQETGWQPDKDSRRNE